MEEKSEAEKKKEVSLFKLTEIEGEPRWTHILHIISVSNLNALALINLSVIWCRLEQGNRIKAEKAKATFDAEKAKAEAKRAKLKEFKAKAKEGKALKDHI